jgi:hypothetical protein
MKKTIITAVAVLGMAAAFGQRVADAKSEFKSSYPFISAKHMETMVYIGFQNLEYSTITDIHAIGLYSDEDLQEFIKALEGAISRCKNKTTVYWGGELENKTWRVYVYDFNNAVYISDTGRISGHTVLSAKKAQKMVDWLKTIKL